MTTKTSAAVEGLQKFLDASGQSAFTVPMRKSLLEAVIEAIRIRDERIETLKQLVEAKDGTITALAQQVEVLRRFSVTI